MTFHEMLSGRVGQGATGPEPLAALPYTQELALKREVLTAFWQENKAGGELLPLTAAPLPRGYRTTSKRRVSWLGPARIHLGYAPGKKAGVAAASPLEPALHGAVYRYCHQALSKTGDQSLGRALNWIVLRGGEAGRIIILVVDHLDAGVVRQAKRLTEGLPALGVAAAMLYVDPTRSDYYLEAERPETGLAVKHLAGPRLLTLGFVDAGTPVRLKYPPTVFSQVNEAMVPELVAAARRLLEPGAGDRLLDLYCGYGLFSFTVGRECRSVTGVELAGEAIETARETARRQGREKSCRFIAGRIDAGQLPALLPAPAGDELQLLDPPRHGTAAGVIAALAARRPRRVLHIACGTDEILPSLAAWQSAGYRLAQAQPLDLFPGTFNLETLLLLVPQG
jgi:tRNA/tmRNA/rRNA uracil-C5-methylase (TrmA/RlmC/RlmD family)